MKNIITICMAALVLASCDIERAPKAAIDSKKITENPEQNIPTMLNGCYAQLKFWSDPMHRCGEYAGDNIMIRGASTDAFFEFISFNRTPQNGRLQQFWDASYKAIAQSSNIINMIEEKKNEKVDAMLGECYYLRGMLYFYLTRAYGRPYYQSPDKNMGVPIVNGTPKNVLSNLKFPDRSTVKECYEQAISDLKNAERLLPSLQDNIKASKEAAQALLSRVYLFMSGTYDNPNNEYAQLAIDYSTKVIDSKKFNLLSREEFMKYNRKDPAENKETIFAIKRLASEFAGYDHYYGVGGMYANIGGMGWGEMYASAKYLNLLNETGINDWRAENNSGLVDARAAFIEPQYVKSQKTSNYVKVIRFVAEEEKTLKDNTKQLELNYKQLPLEMVKDKITPVEGKKLAYTINYKGKEYPAVLDDSIKLNRAYPEFYITKCSREGEDSHLHSPVISRLGEIYLNRAEALAKLKRYDEALADLNSIRSRAIVGGGYNELNASNAEERIDKERQLELAFQAERSYDVFRNGRELTREYPGPHDQFTAIKANDYRVVYFIPQNAINSYPGILTQNPTTN